MDDVLKIKATRVTRNGPMPPAERLAAVRKIVAEKQCAKIDGVLVDGFTASAIVKVYDALNDANKPKFAAMPITRMGILALKMIA